MGSGRRVSPYARCNDTDMPPTTRRTGIEWRTQPKPAPLPRLFSLLIAALAVSGLTAMGPALAGEKVPTKEGPASQVKLPKGASAAWWRRVQQGLAAAEYNPSRNKQGLQAPNRAHNLRTYFGPDGIKLRDRLADRPLIGLSLSAMGRGEALSPVATGTVAQSGKRVEIRRPGIVEWYKNSSQGLEQGFTLQNRADGKGALVLELTVKRAKAKLLGDSIELRTDSGRRLRYGKLVALDANGVKLASHMVTPSPGHLRLVVDDAKAAYPVVIDPLLTDAHETVPDTMLETNRFGPDFFDPPAFGISVASAGDVNDDGFDDVVVGAWGWDGGETTEGAAFVFLGSPIGIVGSTPETAHAHIESNQAAARLGWSVASAGDVNGDGASDIVIGAYLYDSLKFFGGIDQNTGQPWGDRRVTGAGFVFHGSVGSGITGTSPANADAFLQAHALETFLGFSVASAGDINGDGFSDIILGAPLDGISFQEIPGVPPNNIPPNDRSGNTGAVLVFHGSASGITGTGYDDANAILTPYPPNAPDNNEGSIGGDVAGAGDVNGDGFSDVIVTDASTALVFLGSASGLQGRYPGDAHAVITLDAGAITAFGEPAVTSVAGAGNVNGDINSANGRPYDDIVIGARTWPVKNSTTQEGAAFVFHGGPAGITATDALSTADSKFIGNILAEWVGFDVAGVGDVDSDGFDDIAIAARVFPGSLDSEGVAHIFRGGINGIDDTNGLSGSYARLGSGQTDGVRRLNRYALSVNGARDVNGDGFADVIMGAGYYDNPEQDEGAVFVFHGGPSPAIGNEHPVPDAGPDNLFVDVDNDAEQTVITDGTNSSDPDGTIVSYRWTEGETVLGTLPVLKTALPRTGDHEVVLTVTDDVGISRGDPVTLRVEPVPDQQVLNDDFALGLTNWASTGDVTTGTFNTPFPEPPQARIRGAGSTLSRAISLPTGATGATMSFWGRSDQMSASDSVALQISFNGGPFTTLRTFTSADNSDTLTFYGGSAERLGFSWYPQTAATAEIRFLSSTGAGAFIIDSVVARALFVPPGTPLPVPGLLPLVDAGVDITVDDGGNATVDVTLDGSLSSDPDGSISSYEWFELTNAGPILLGNSAVLPDTSFSHGTHTVQLLVTDNQGGSASDTVNITVNQTFPNNQPPIANAGPDQTIEDINGDTLEVVTINGSGSTDPDGNIVSYVWRKNGNFYSNAASQSATQPIGVHTFELTVTDDQGATSTDTVVVTVVANAASVIIDNFSANPGIITQGDSTVLSWLTTGATSVSISNGVGTGLPPNGSISVSPSVNTLYTLTATGPGGTHIRSVTIGVNPPAPDPTTIDSFSVTPSTITEGNSATLSWTTSGADSVSINNGVGAGLALDGNISVSPTVTTTYTLTAGGPGGPATSNVTVTVEPASPIAPTVDSFGATPTTIAAGGSATLTWTTTDADSVSIDNGGGAGWPADSSISVSPVATTTYTLTATGPGGTTTDTVDITVQAAPPAGSDFRTQMVKMTIPAGTGSVVSSAFAPVDPSRTVALISGITQHAMGWTAQSTQDPVEISAHVDLGAGGNTLTATRASAMNQPDTVWVLLVEYIGPPGGANELLVRDRRVHAWSAGQTNTSYGAIGSVNDGSRIVVFGAGSSNTNTASSSYDRGDVRAWLDGANNVQLVRGDGSGAISSSHQVVEFVGGNWTVQTGETTPSGDPGGTDVAITSVADMSNAWVYFTWSTNSANLDERGHRVWLTSPNTLRVQEDAAATGTKTVRWSVISNLQMQVQTGAADNVLTSANSGTITGFSAVADLTQSFAWVSGMTDGGGNAHSRDMWQFELLDSSTINLQRGYNGQELSYRYFVVELPTGGGSPPPPPNVDPVASFAVATADLAATYTDSSTDSDGTVVAWSWDFGDGGNSTEQNPLTHTYASAGIYTVSLTVTDDRGGSHTASQPVTVSAVPNVDPAASFTVATNNLSATFADSSTDSDGTVIAWSWDFGDGGISTAQNPPTHAYATAGSYTVSLNVTDDRGGSSTTSQSVTVTAPPNVDPVASFTVATNNLSATFGDSSTDSDGTVNSWSWDFGDGGVSTVQNPPAHNYASAGTYTVSLTVTDDRGGSNVVTQSVTVTAAPPPPPPSQGSVSISGPTSVDRGDRTSFTVTLTNTGSSTITGAQLSFNFSPTSLLKNVTPGSSVLVSDVAPGGSVSQTWNVRGDNEGSGTVTVEALGGGVSLDTASQSLTVVK